METRTHYHAMFGRAVFYLVLCLGPRLRLHDRAILQCSAAGRCSPVADPFHGQLVIPVIERKSLLAEIHWRCLA